MVTSGSATFRRVPRSETFRLEALTIRKTAMIARISIRLTPDLFACANRVFIALRPSRWKDAWAVPSSDAGPGGDEHAVAVQVLRPDGQMRFGLWLDGREADWQ